MPLKWICGVLGYCNNHNARNHTDKTGSVPKQLPNKKIKAKKSRPKIKIHFSFCAETMNSDPL
jgi:hypothetical protein